MSDAHHTAARTQHLSNKRALITGAGGGIGSAVARRLAQEGATVVAADIDTASTVELLASIEADGGIAESWEVDLSDADALAEASLEVDLLVNNAGLQHVAAIQDFPVAMWHRIQAVMVTAPFLLIRAALPHMYSTGWGRVVNISSAHGLRASEFKSAYVTAKHGLEGLSKVTALEGAPHGVRSVCINPGYVWTPLVEQQLADQASARGISEDEVADQVLLAKQPVKDFTRVEDVAEAVAFACGPASNSLTGGNISLDGGWIAQ